MFGLIAAALLAGPAVPSVCHQQGCCSHHQGVCNCSNGRKVCC